jgi:RNA-directed DNA polymerase
MWLEAPVEETDERGNQRRSTRNRDEGRGTPQGAPISPLLSNLYMRRFVLVWKKLGYEERWEAYIVNYADDLVICCRTGAEQALATMQEMMSKLKLTVNDSKTRVCALPEEKFDFLGYTFGQCYSPKTGRAYLGTIPARKRVHRICGEIREMTGRNTTSLDPVTIVTKLNRTMGGWANYFCLGPVSTAYRAVDSYAKMRLRLWLRTKHKLSGRANGMFPDTHLYGDLGLVRLDKRTRNFPWAKVCVFSESRMREIRLSGSMSGMWKRSRVNLVRHRQTKEPGTDRGHLNHRATSRLYRLISTVK